MRLPRGARADLEWWANNCIFPLPDRKIMIPTIDFTVHTDASLTGWSMSCSDGFLASGSWSPGEARLHINNLELLAIYKSLGKLQEKMRNRHIHIITDNSTAMHYVQNMGGTHSQSMCNLALEISKLSAKCSIWLSVFHIAGVKHKEADFLSRLPQYNHDYSLNL